MPFSVLVLPVILKKYHIRAIISFLTRIVMGSIPSYSKVLGEKKNRMLFSATSTKGRSILFNHFIDMRTTVNLSISCRKNLFLLKFSNKNTFFLHEMDKLMVVLMSIK